MDLNKLNTFYILAKTRNYSKCAKKLFVTQSAVSHAIKALEQSLDLNLTEKRKNGFALTPEGQFLFNSCKTIFTEVEKTRNQLEKRENIPEEIRLGAPVEFGINVIIRHMAPFLEARPLIHVDFCLNNDLLGSLMDDELDLIVDCRPHNRPGLEYIPMLREAYTVVASKHYIQKMEIESVTDLEQCNLISMDKDMIWWQNFINALPKDITLRFKQVTQIDHIRGIIEACMASIGVGFVPSYTVDKALSAGHLTALFPEIDVLKDQIGIYYKKRAAARPAICELTRHLQQIKF